jgi:hypothetical protein
VPPPPKTSQADLELADFIGSCYADPLRYVLGAFPWREPGPLERYDGPDTWQRETLIYLGEEVRKRRFDGVHAVSPIRIAIPSAHGTGKSVMAGWLANWIMSTRPGSRGTITANTFQQLQTKTFASVRYWASLSITSHWFDVSSDRMRHKSDPNNWFCSAQTCREENSEAFAGQHAASSSSWYLLDEASAIPDTIWTTCEGGLTDGQPMIFAFGNPTRRSGKFFRITFGDERERWYRRIIDGRESKFTNKDLIAEWIKDYGEDSDFVRVRVRGLPPKAGDLQFIDSERVWNAQRRKPTHFKDDPLVLGFDVARGGADESIIWFRRGLDAASIKPIRFTGEESRDSMFLATKLATVMDTEYDGVKPRMCFIDSGFGGAVCDRLHQLGFKNVHEVAFGGRAPDKHMANMRAHMWNAMRLWLERGSIPNDPELETDLTGPGYKHDKHDRLVLESKDDMKRRGLASPNRGDALALCFAQPVAPSTTPSALKKYTGSLYLGDYQSAWMA